MTKNELDIALQIERLRLQQLTLGPRITPETEFEDRADYAFFDSETDHNDHVFTYFDWQSGAECYTPAGCNTPDCPRCAPDPAVICKLCGQPIGGTRCTFKWRD